MKTITITGEKLTIEAIIKVACENALVKLGDLEKAEKSADVIARKVKKKERIYGVTTGFGAFASILIDNEEDARDLQVNLLLSHATGVGNNFPTRIVRAIMLIRLNTLMKGNSGVRVGTLRQLECFLNNKVHPIVPQQGSLGASGDLCPLSHLALPLIGKGFLEYGERTYKAEDFYKLPEIEKIKRRDGVKLEPLKLSYKEGLALNNGTSVMAALGTFAIHEFTGLLKLATLTSSLMLEAFCARKEAFDKRIHDVRKHDGQKTIAEWVRKFTEGSSFVGISSTTLRNALTKVKAPALTEAIEELAKKKDKPQDAYSFRCMPQVFGASLHALNHAREVFDNEINAAVDNPLIFIEQKEVLSGGNFHGQPLALVLDYLKLAIAEIGNIVERQINKLVDPATNDDLRAFLVHNEKGINSGLMIPQYVAASLVSENKVLVHPASADSIPTSANTEDHVSMGAIAGRQALEILGNVKNVVIIAILTAHHAMQVREDQFKNFGINARRADATEALFRKVKEVIPDFDKIGEEDHFLNNDRFLYEDINRLTTGKDPYSLTREEDVSRGYEDFVALAEKYLAK